MRESFYKIHLPDQEDGLLTPGLLYNKIVETFIGSAMVKD
jgi:hypothetical protein